MTNRSHGAHGTVVITAHRFARKRSGAPRFENVGGEATRSRPACPTVRLRRATLTRPSVQAKPLRARRDSFKKFPRVEPNSIRSPPHFGSLPPLPLPSRNTEMFARRGTACNRSRGEHGAVLVNTGGLGDRVRR